MKIKSAQEMFDEGETERQGLNLDLDPLQALRLRIASKRVNEQGGCRLGSDSIGRALSIIEHGAATSLLEAYDGPLSPSVLADLIEAGSHCRPTTGAV